MGGGELKLGCKKIDRYGVCVFNFPFEIVEYLSEENENRNTRIDDRLFREMCQR